MGNKLDRLIEYILVFAIILLLVIIQLLGEINKVIYWR